jgi:hypothetical protein
MLQIEFEKLKGKTFTDNLGNKFICIGYGQAPDTGANYVVGAIYDQQRNDTMLKSALIKDVKFEGNLLQ